MTDEDNSAVPTLDEIRATHGRIAPHVVRTPVQRWHGPMLEQRLGLNTEAHLKLEIFQPTGTFKARGAINNALAMTEEQRRAGITTISAGNHAIAASYAAASVGASAKVLMMSAANLARIEAARRYGADVTLVDDIDDGFARIDRMQKEEGRTYIPSFPNKGVVCGTATIALELFEQVENVDAVIVPVGGGGLISGISACFKMLNPACKVYGVEPSGAGVMSKSIKAGSLQQMDKMTTIADSISPPITNQYAMSIVSKYVDDIVQITDDEMSAAAALLFYEMSLSVEPAGAASTAALLGPLRETLTGKKVALIICGSNIDASSYADFLARGVRALNNGKLPPR